MAFGYRFTKTTAFTESARRYNPKLFVSLHARPSRITLREASKNSIEEFATNLEHMLGSIEGAREPMRKDSAFAYADTMAETSAA
ncbi:MAG: hypothetical protein EB059_01995 [Alphaproteobacteria bacterium]|nr:hypothetical protein [Alphaproteobacteria bacterium]